MPSWFRRKPARPAYSGESIQLTCADPGRAAGWWVEVFGCERAPLPEWDDPLPSDIALRFAGADEPVILISDRLEAEHAGLTRQNSAQRVWTPNLDEAFHDLQSRGAIPGAIQGERVRFFRVEDPEDNAIEVCEE